MRKLIASINLSLDGYLSRPDGELDWHTSNWSTDMGEAMCRQLAAADTLLLGRVTYEAMAAYWQARAVSLSCSGDDPVLADMLQRYVKVVVSRKLVKAPWNNSIIWSAAIPEKLRLLKEQGSRDIILYGSCSLLSTLLPAGLIDEYRLWIHPVAIGKGAALFRSLGESRALRLTGMERFNSGVVLLTYQKMPGDQ